MPHSNSGCSTMFKSKQILSSYFFFCFRDCAFVFILSSSLYFISNIFSYSLDLQISQINIKLSVVVSQSKKHILSLNEQQYLRASDYFICFNVKLGIFFKNLRVSIFRGFVSDQNLIFQHIVSHIIHIHTSVSFILLY